MASNKIVLRTAHAGDVFWLDENIEVTSEGTEFSSKQAAADAIRIAARSGVQLFVVEPTDPDAPEDRRTEQALIASGLVAEDETPPKPKPAAQSQGNQQGGNG